MHSTMTTRLARDEEEHRIDVHKRTRLCKFFLMGSCTRGAGCNFAHGARQLRTQPDFSKTRLCAEFMESGTCPSKDCKFAHGRHELRPGELKRKPKAEKTQPPPAATPVKTVHSLHEQAALRLVLESACFPRKTEGYSFSRQTTWEGIETEFNRAISASSGSQEDPEPEGELTDWHVEIKNTFIEVKEKEVPLRRTQSLPKF
ncbi:unnamed protein product [Effrenium voratum]|uniref:C3H1-type domain-containing protein n=1 Tax=Effrenium voratum TaxID=2562239 RepID=A0AA36HVB8_9DINO|nr:unnamed protein product [Effrenium voratum]CAJ1376025.1 unnamed protein product [Effrenium voratum]